MMIIISIIGSHTPKRLRKEEKKGEDENKKEKVRGEREQQYIRTKRKAIE